MGENSLKFIAKELVDSFRNKDAYTKVEKGSFLFYLVLTFLSFGFLALFSYYTYMIFPFALIQTASSEVIKRESVCHYPLL